MLDAVFDGLRSPSPASDLARATWRAAGSLRIRREEPVWTARGKLMPLHLRALLPSPPDRNEEHLAVLGLCPILLLASCRQSPSHARRPPRTQGAGLRTGPPSARHRSSSPTRAGISAGRGSDVELVGLDNSEGLPALIEGGMDVLAGQVQPRYFNAIARGAPIRIVADKGHLDPASCGYVALVAGRGSCGTAGSPPPDLEEVAHRRAPGHRWVSSSSIGPCSPKASTPPPSRSRDVSATGLGGGAAHGGLWT